MSVVVAHSVRGTDSYLIFDVLYTGAYFVVFQCVGYAQHPVGAAAVTEKIPITIKTKSVRFFFMCFNISKIL